MPTTTLDQLRQWEAEQTGKKPEDSGVTSVQELQEWERSKGLWIRPQTSPLPYQGYFENKANESKAIDERLKLATGGKYDSNDFEMEWKDHFNNWRLARTNTAVGRTNKFLELYPEGQIMYVPHEDIGGGTWVARRNPEEPFRKIGGIGSELAADFISEEAVGGVVGELAASRSPGNPLGHLVLPALGMATGNVIRNIQQAPYEKMSTAELAKKGLTTGAIGMLGNFIAKGGTLGVAKNLLFPPVNREFRNETIRGAIRRGLMPLTEGQATTNPLEQAMYAQQTRVLESSRLEALKRFGYGSEKTGKGLRGELESFVEKYGFEGLDDDTLNYIIGKETANIGNTLKGLRRKEISYDEAGEALRSGLKIFKKAGEAKYNKLYKEAFDLSDDVVFDITPLKKAVEDIRRRIYSRGIPREEKVLTATGWETRKIEPIVEIPSTLEKGSVLDKIMEAIENMNPVVSKYSTGGKVFKSFEQLKNLRTSVGELGWNTEGYTHKVARDLYEELTSILDNPVSGNADFVAKYKEAQGAFRTVKDVMDLRYINKLNDADLGTYATYAKQLASPGKYFQLDLLKNTLPKDSWETLRNAFLYDITQDYKLAANRLHRWWQHDKKGLSLLLSESEKDTIVNWSKAMRDLEKSLPYKVWLNKDQDLTARALEIIRQGDERDLRTLINLSGGIDSKTADSLRAAVVEHWLSVPGVRIDDKLAGPVMNANTFTKLIEAQENNQVLKALFRKDDWDWYKDIKNYATFIGDIPSSGASIQVGEVASGVQKVGPEVAEKGVKQVYKAFKLPIGMRVLALFRDYNKNAKEINTVFTREQAKAIRAYLQVMLAGSSNITNKETPDKTTRDTLRSMQGLPFEPETVAE